VLAVITFRGRGRQSGVEVNMEFFQLWTFDDGKVIRGQGFLDRDEALEAAGLRE
jgi:ketosteroid isomerase-like protein